jgi:hypothetical protein
MSQQFCDEDENQLLVDIKTPGLVIVLDTIQVITQMVPATALGLFADTIIAGHDKTFAVKALQADNTTAFNLTGIPILFYAKVTPSLATTVFSKSLANNPLDLVVPSPTNGIVNVFVRTTDYASLPLGTTMFLYVDVVNNIGNPVNIAKWVLTITD